MARLLLADAIHMKASSSSFRDLVAASAKYGFTKGNYNSSQIEVTGRGAQAVSASPEQSLEARRAAFRSVPAFEKTLQFYKDNKLPSKDFMSKAIQSAPISVAQEWAAEFVDVFTKAAREIGFIRDVTGDPYIMLDAGPPVLDMSYDALDDTSDEDDYPAVEPEIANPGTGSIVDPPSDQPSKIGSKPLQFFVAHGTSSTPVDQLKRILDQFSIPYLVAQDEPHSGRPISQKVKDLMDECTGGIFIFSGDEKLFDADGREILRPRENVVFELGAASYLYGRSIVVFKEEGVTFPSDFSDLGWIPFEKDHLDAKAMALLQELIGLRAVKLMPGE